MSGWDAYIQTLTSTCSEINRVAIIGNSDANVWARTEGKNEFKASESELKKLVDHFDKLNEVPSVGADLEGIHYIVPRTDENLIFGKRDKNGFFAVKTKSAILIAVYYDEDNASGADVRGAVEKMAKYLEDAAVLYEKWDSVVSAYSDHLNVSLLFYRDRYKLDDELLRLDTFSIGDKLERLNLLRHHSAFLISLAHTSKAKLLIREFARDCSIPTIQAQVSSWSGLSKSSFNDGTSLDNFVHLVPAFVVFDNIVHELVQLLNITEFLVLFDKHFDEEVQFEWKKPFVSALKNVHFEPMFTKISDATEHVKQLNVEAKNIFIVASTKNAELYMQAAIPQFEARHFRNFIVFTKDTLALKCEDCLSANLSWVRMMPNGRVQTLRKFNDFLRQEELEMIYQVPVPTFYETQLSFCLDIMEIATKYLLLTNHSLAKAAKKRPEGFVEWENGQNTSEKGAVTLKRLMQERSLDFEFGRYEFHFGEVYYQAVIGMILKVERRVDDPEVDFHKYIGNWTLEKGIQPLYDNLSVDVRGLNHYRIVTIIVESMH
uniref:Profilin n=1 Tax=Globodera pallida TaxID=36090 RepID=A0A183C952_GLOPA